MPTEKTETELFSTTLLTDAKRALDEYQTALDNVPLVALGSRCKWFFDRAETLNRVFKVFKTTAIPTNQRYKPENYTNAETFSPRRKQTLDIPKLANFNTPIMTHPICLTKYKAYLKAKPFSEPFSALKQICFEIKCGQQDELLSGFIAIHHQTCDDLIIPIYLSNQKVNIFIEDLLDNGFDTLKVTFCINETVRPGGKQLGAVFIADVKAATNQIDAKHEARKAADQEILDQLKEKRNKELIKLQRHCETLEKWRDDWSKWEVRLTEDERASLGVDKDFSRTHQEGLTRIRDKELIINELTVLIFEKERDKV